MIFVSRLAATGMPITCLIPAFVLPTATAWYSVNVVFVPLFAWGLANFGDDVVDLVGIPGGRTTDISVRGVRLLVLIALSGAVLYLSALDAPGTHERAGLTAHPGGQPDRARRGFARFGGRLPYRRPRLEQEVTMNYRAAYSIGFHPWEDAVTDPPFVSKFVEMIAREEKGRSAPFGAALDLGTGSGIWGIELAKRGWQVTGIDIVERALERARERIRQAGVNMRLVKGDVTALRNAGISNGFRLILDTGTFHDFDTAAQQAMGREVDAVSTPDTTVLLLVWPRRTRPLIRGATRGEIEAAFPGWTITHVEASHFRLPRILEAILRPDEHWYRLRRA